MVCRIGRCASPIYPLPRQLQLSLGPSAINPETAPPPLTRPPANEGRFEAFDPLSPR